MSIDTQVSAQPPVIQPIKMFGKMGLYWADTLDALERIEASGVNIYYVIGNEKIVEKVNNVDKTFFVPQFFRVERSLVGRSILHVETKELDMFSQISVSAEYSLPKMPYEFVVRANAFFMKAHKVHGTESIIVLTYDPSYLDTDNPGAGWGCLVPDQENTSTNCKYDLQSVMSHKPENVQIVGSWHSHPEMSAFFSSTDHHDQDDWDGLHITTGWRAKQGYEYHIALVMGGQNWSYKPEQIFSVPPPPEVDTSIVDAMVEKVKKKTIVSTTTYSHTTMVTGTAGTSTIANVPGRSVQARAIKLPANAPDPTKVTIIACVSPEATNSKCPFCKVPLSANVWASQRCIGCQSFLLEPGSTLEDLVKYRADNGKHYILAIDPERAPNPIVLWTPAIALTDEDVFSDDMRTLVGVTIEAGQTDPK